MGLKKGNRTRKRPAEMEKFCYSLIVSEYLTEEKERRKTFGGYLIAPDCDSAETVVPIVYNSDGKNMISHNQSKKLRELVKLLSQVSAVIGRLAVIAPSFE